MSALLRFWELVTTDVLTLAATSVLAIAALGLVVAISWPARDKSPNGSLRSARARALVASGASAVDVARKTGLSRDALALMVGNAGPGARKKTPGTARLAFSEGGRNTAATVDGRGQARA